jgi:benzylsuccinate CoA-transferase BbsE subunit
LQPDPTSDPRPAALAHLRVVDLTQHYGYASKMFAQMGSDVMLVEPPEGIVARRRGPFLDGGEPGQSSLHFHYLSAGKRSIVIDLTHGPDRAVFAELIATADIVLDDHLQGYWRNMGLGYEVLARRHPNLVWCAITPFGQTGPWCKLSADDFICMAAGGMAWLTGYEDTGPLVADGELSIYSAAQYAAVISLLAAFGRARVGCGQFIDVSVQEVVALGTETAPQFQELKGVTRRRLGERERQAGIGVYPCKDGAVLLYAATTGLGAGWPNLVRWLIESGVPGAEELAKPQWSDNAFKALDRSRTLFRETFTRFAAPRGKQELFEEGQRRRIAIAPVNDSADVLADPHLNACGFFTPLKGIAERPVIGPGGPYWLSRTHWTSCGAAPLLGEHTEELRHELMRRAAAS